MNPLSRRELLWFELTAGLTTSVRVLQRRLGLARASRAFAALAWRSTRDPLADVPATDWPAWQEELTRRQLRPVVLLDDIAREDLRLSDGDRTALLTEIVAEIGARFVARHAPPVPIARWRAASVPERERFARELSTRLPNARVAEVTTGDDCLAFDVTACRFVELCRALGRPELASLFCAADSRHFDREGSPLRLTRSGTLAGGASCCDFAFGYQDTRAQDCTSRG